jgi:transcriptional regulator with XRE-family HTH domain
MTGKRRDKKDKKVIYVPGFDPNEFGRRVAFVRELIGMTQDELAEKVGLSRASIINIENNYRGTRPEVVLLLAQALGTTTDYLLAASTAKEPNPAKAKQIARITAIMNECDFDNKEIDDLETVLMLWLRNMRKTK